MLSAFVKHWSRALVRKGASAAVHGDGDRGNPAGSAGFSRGWKLYEYEICEDGCGWV